MVFLKKEENRQKKNIEKWRGKKNEEYRDSQIMTINIFSFKEQKHWKMKREKNEEYRDSKIMTIKNFSFKEEKHWKMKTEKNEEYRDSQIMTINILSFTFDIIIIFFSKT